MGSNKKLWRIEAIPPDSAIKAFRDLRDLAEEIRSSIDRGCLEHHAAKVVGVIIEVATRTDSREFQNTAVWGYDLVQVHTARANWPSIAEIILTCGMHEIEVSEEEAKRYLETAKLLMLISAKGQLGLSFYWHEVKG